MIEKKIFPRDLRIPRGTIFSNWSFNIGDIVSSFNHGIGIVISRRIEDQYVMDRPSKICQFETYSVSFSSKLKSVYRCEITKIEDGRIQDR
jgi:hypothetical protein